MSEHTAQRLAEAQEDAARLRAVADDAIDACLRSIADRLPQRLDGRAKSVAQAQPDVTRSLGSEGLQGLRATLDDAARKLGEKLRGAAAEVDWPEASSEYSQITADKVASALFHYLYGPPCMALASIFREHGFQTQDRPGPHQSFILPQTLIAGQNLTPVAEALAAAGAADRVVLEAKALDDEDVVAELWNDSSP